MFACVCFIVVVFICGSALRVFACVVLCVLGLCVLVCFFFLSACLF